MSGGGEFVAGKKWKEKAEKILLSAMRGAMRIEKQGIRFYSRAARGVKDPNGKAILEFLADEERRHLLLFENLARSFRLTAKSSQTLRVMRSHAPDAIKKQVKILKKPRIFPKPIEYHKRHDVAMDVKIMDEAIKVEKKSIALYEEYKRELGGKDKGMKHALQLVIDEEKQHLDWFEFARGDAKLHSYWAELEEHFSIQG